MKLPLPFTFAAAVACALAPAYAQQGNQNPLNVIVSNPTTNPARVRDVAESSKERLQIMLQSGVGITYTVPSGKRLTIEYVSFFCTVTNSPDQLWAIGLSTTNANYGLHYFVPTKTATVSPNTYFAGSQNTQIYADPATNVHYFYHGVGGAAPSCAVTFSGHLSPV